MLGLADLLDVLGITTPDWRKNAACVEHPGLAWVPTKGEDSTAQRAICAGCLARADCLSAGLDGHELGIWGGTTAAERDRIRRGLPARIISRPTPPPTVHADPGPCVHLGCNKPATRGRKGLCDNHYMAEYRRSRRALIAV